MFRSEINFWETLQLEAVFAPHKTSTLPEVFASAEVSATRISPSASVAAPLTKDPLNPAVLTKRLGPVFRDETGKWVDKLLGWYYMRGKCDGCDRNHVPTPFKAREFDCLWVLTRRGLCFKIRKGKDCDDRKCVYGHEGHPMGSVMG